MKSNLSRLSVAALVSATLMGTVAPTSTYATTHEATSLATTTYEAKTAINLYTSTSTGSSVLKVIPQGAAVNVLSTHGATGSWLKLSYGGKTGYAPARSFTPVSITFYATTTAVLYNATGSGAKKIATIPAGAKVAFLASYGATGSWYKLQYGSTVGYAPARNFSNSLQPSATLPPLYATTNVAVYDGSASGSRKITTIPQYAKVERLVATGLSSSWVKIRYGTTTGYASAKHFSTSLLEAPVRTTYYASRDVVLYASSASGAARLSVIKAGTKVTQISDSSLATSWFKLEVNGMTGFAGASHFSKTAPETVVVTPYYATTNVAMYDSSGSGSSKIDTIPFGAKVEQLSQSGLSTSWFKVRYNGKVGYVASRHFSLKQPEVVVKTPYYASRDIVLYDRSDANKVRIATIPQGTLVQQLSEAGLSTSWFKVEYGTQVGYATASNFSTSAPNMETYGPEQQVRIVVAGNGPLNVRKEPSASSTKMGELSSGTTLSVKPVLTTSWARITSGNFAGHYIHTDYMVPVVTPPPVAGIEKKVVYSSYPISLASMVTTQYNQIAQTDSHINKPGYLPRSWVKVEGKVGTIVNHKMQTASNLGTPLRTSPSTSAASLITVPARVTFDYLERQTVGSTVWYKAQYGSMIGYVPATAVVGEASLLSRDSLSSHAFGQVNPGEKVTILGQVGNYYTALYKRPAGHNIRIFDNMWRRASREEIQSYADPTQVDPNSRAFYQFLDLSKPAGTKATSLNNLLVNKGTLTGQGQAFISAANQYSINEIYLLAHALHETGNGLSRLASGVPVDKDGNALINSAGTRIYPDRPVAATVYNMYGIQAIDSNPLGNGAKFAFQQKWFSPEQAIIGGAYWIGSSYINHATYKQNTLYKMRFNPASPGVHQYATNIAWSYHQTAKIYEFYQTLDAYSIQFDVPKFQ